MASSGGNAGLTVKLRKAFIGLEGYDVVSTPMDDKTRGMLAELRAAIDDLAAGHGDQHRLADLAGAVERRLHAEEELADDDDTLAEDLREAAVRLEADHPHLAGALRRAVDILGGMGL